MLLRQLKRLGSGIPSFGLLIDLFRCSLTANLPQSNSQSSTSAVIEFFHKGRHANFDVVSDAPDAGDGQIFRVGQIPIDVAPTWNYGTFVTAAHRHHDVRPPRQVIGQLSRHPSTQIDAFLFHDRDDVGVNAVSRRGPCGARFVMSIRSALEQRLAHL